RNVTNYMGTLRKVKGVHPLMDKGFQLLWYICMGEVQLYHAQKRVSQISPHRTLTHSFNQCAWCVPQNRSLEQ
ncbi:hypothetical protein, partial [Microcystis aeruginosa]|uniref:hypothetical protein n=1 Tax=Microcystis aeruginosa TaxID=1126 RepID=UPI001B8C58D7